MFRCSEILQSSSDENNRVANSALAGLFFCLGKLYATDAPEVEAGRRVPSSVTSTVLTKGRRLYG